MTDRIKGCVVTFDDDIREDDIKMVLNAIRHIVHVQDVEVRISDVDDQINRSRIRREMINDLYEVIKKWNN